MTGTERNGTKVIPEFGGGDYGFGAFIRRNLPRRRKDEQPDSPRLSHEQLEDIEDLRDLIIQELSKIKTADDSLDQKKKRTVISSLREIDPPVSDMTSLLQSKELQDLELKKNYFVGIGWDHNLENARKAKKNLSNFTEFYFTEESLGEDSDRHFGFEGYADGTVRIWEGTWDKQIGKQLYAKSSRIRIGEMTQDQAERLSTGLNSALTILNPGKYSSTI